MSQQRNMNEVQPAGMISFFANSSPPSGWLRCDGSAVSRTTYSDLFAAIGTLYGAGDGSTTFNIPDLRGEFIRVFDAGRGVDAGRAFGSAQAQSVESRTHAPPAETGLRNVALLACIKY